MDGERRDGRIGAFRNGVQLVEGFKRAADAIVCPKGADAFKRMKKRWRRGGNSITIHFGMIALFG